MVEEICMNCKHSLKIDDMDYQCRRYAPRRIHGVGTGESTTKFPTVRLDDWCGEFCPKEELSCDQVIETRLIDFNSALTKLIRAQTKLTRLTVNELFDCQEYNSAIELRDSYMKDISQTFEKAIKERI